MPKGTFKRFWNYIKQTIRENKAATVIGILIGGVGTRFLEDGNLLVTTVLTGMSATATLAVWLIIKKLKVLLMNDLNSSRKRLSE
jgi:hypothetical protein